MNEFFKIITSKKYAIPTFTIFVILLSSITLLSLVSFSQSKVKLKQVKNQYQPKMLHATQLSTHFYQSLSVLGNYLIEQDTKTLQRYLSKIKDIDNSLEALTQVTQLNYTISEWNSIVKIKKLVDKIKNANKLLLHLAVNLQTNFPAIGKAENELEPLGGKIQLQLNDLMVFAENSNNNSLMFNIGNLRFIWTMVVSESRNYLAFRNAQTISHIDMYIDGFVQAKRVIHDSESMLDPNFRELFEETTQKFPEYQSLLANVLKLHASKEWRQDQIIMRTIITPTLNELTHELEMLIALQRKQIKSSHQDLSDHLTFSVNIILVATVIAAFIAFYMMAMSLRSRALHHELKRRKVKEDKMWLQANYDFLTNLANRALFNKSLTSYIEEEDKSTGKFSLLFIDLDGFKQVNDNISHAAGDFVLVETAKRLKAAVRNIDIVSRLGGDEFTVLLKNTNSQPVAENIAQQICQALNKEFVYEEDDIHISCSIGILLSKTNHFDTKNKSSSTITANILAKADYAMYKAKNGGKNNFYLYDNNTDRESVVLKVVGRCERSISDNDRGNDSAVI